MCEQGVNVYITRFSPRKKLKRSARFFYISCIVMVENRRNCCKKNSDNDNNTNDCVSNISIYFWVKNKTILISWMNMTYLHKY